MHYLFINFIFKKLLLNYLAVSSLTFSMRVLFQLLWGLSLGSTDSLVVVPGLTGCSVSSLVAAGRLSLQCPGLVALQYVRP